MYSSNAAASPNPPRRDVAHVVNRYPGARPQPVHWGTSPYALRIVPRTSVALSPPTTMPPPSPIVIHPRLDDDTAAENTHETGQWPNHLTEPYAAPVSQQPDSRSQADHDEPDTPRYSDADSLSVRQREARMLDEHRPAAAPSTPPSPPMIDVLEASASFAQAKTTAIIALKTYTESNPASGLIDNWTEGQFLRLCNLQEKERYGGLLTGIIAPTGHNFFLSLIAHKEVQALYTFIGGGTKHRNKALLTWAIVRCVTTHDPITRELVNARNAREVMALLLRSMEIDAATLRYVSWTYIVQGTGKAIEDGETDIWTVVRDVAIALNAHQSLIERILPNALVPATVEAMIVAIEGESSIDQTEYVPGGRPPPAETVISKLVKNVLRHPAMAARDTDNLRQYANGVRKELSYGSTDPLSFQRFFHATAKDSRQEYGGPILAERGREGIPGPCSLLYHQHRPSQTLD